MEGSAGDAETRLSEHSPPVLASLSQNGDDVIQESPDQLGEGHSASRHSEAHEDTNQGPANPEIADLPSNNTRQPAPDGEIVELGDPSSSFE